MEGVYERQKHLLFFCKIVEYLGADTLIAMVCRFGNQKLGFQFV